MPKKSQTITGGKFTGWQAARFDPAVSRRDRPVFRIWSIGGVMIFPSHSEVAGNLRIHGVARVGHPPRLTNCRPRCQPARAVGAADTASHRNPGNFEQAPWNRSRQYRRDRVTGESALPHGLESGCPGGQASDITETEPTTLGGPLSAGTKSPVPHTSAAKLRESLDRAAAGSAQNVLWALRLFLAYDVPTFGEDCGWSPGTQATWSY